MNNLVYTHNDFAFILVVSVWIVDGQKFTPCSPFDTISPKDVSSKFYQGFLDLPGPSGQLPTSSLFVLKNGNA